MPQASLPSIFQIEFVMEEIDYAEPCEKYREDGGHR